MTVSTRQLVTAAAELQTAEATRRPVERLCYRYPDLTIDKAYDIAQLNIDRRVAAGATVVGHKVGLTSRAMQQQMQVGQPDSGVLLDDMMIADGAELDVGALLIPRIEAEIAVWLGRDLAGADTDARAAAAAVDRVCIALEVIDSRFPGWQVSIVDTVADNASSARAVVGADRRFASHPDVADELVVLAIDGEDVARGLGSAVLGHPLEAVAWLARRLAGRGAALSAGSLVLTGAVHASVELHAGSCVTARGSTLPPAVLRTR